MVNFKYDVVVKLYSPKENKRRVAEKREKLEYKEIKGVIRDLLCMYRLYIESTCDCVKIKIVTSGTKHVLYKQRFMVKRQVDGGFKLEAFTSKIRRFVEKMEFKDI